VVDFDGLEAAGIANARQRAGLIEYLDSLGFTVEEMAEAERHGRRLFQLAGDAVRRSGPPTYSLRAAAERLGCSVDAVAGHWAMLGLTVADSDQIALSEADVDGLSTCTDMERQWGEDPTAGLLRLIGASVARLAEAEASATRISRPEFWITTSHDELTTARTYRTLAELIPRIGALIDAVHRQHLERPNLFANVLRDPSASLECGVGFVDVSGFTALTQLLSPADLSALLSGFSATVSDVVHVDDSRLVKFIGDAVMWVSSTPEQLVRTAVDLVAHPRVRDAGLQLRGGLSFGTILAINGDYFGNAVNLAARLVASASPGQILAASDVRDALPDWPAIPQDPLLLKGFDEPVVAFDMSHGGG
jgi:class 3 adenylate cyclase